MSSLLTPPYVHHTCIIICVYDPMVPIHVCWLPLGLWQPTALASSPGPIPAFQCSTQKSGRAWYANYVIRRKKGRKKVIARRRVKGQLSCERSRLQQVRNTAISILTECGTIHIAFRKVLNKNQKRALRWERAVEFGHFSKRDCDVTMT